MASNVEPIEKPNQKEQLLSLFASRVLNQARVVIDAWQRLPEDPAAWNIEQFDLFVANDSVTNFQRLSVSRPGD